MSQNAVVVTGIGLTTALGPTAKATWQKLEAGRSAIALHQPFLDLEPLPLAMRSQQPEPLKNLTKRVARAAWLDAKLDPDGAGSMVKNQPGLGFDCGVVIGSSRSHLRDWEAMTARLGNVVDTVDGDWLAALPHNPALTVARSVGAKGPLLAPVAACATGVWALAQAADLIRSGQCQRAIAGAVESPITPLTIAGFRKMGALATTGCYPFDQRREGFVLGEGGAVLVLESAALAAERGAEVYGKILAAGITNDSHHVSSFDPSYAMGERAVAMCLQRSGLIANDIDAVHVHGTSTQQNDRMEASLIHQLFSRQKEIPLMATKGATGHTLGASGALIVALSLMSIKAQQLLPCVGLQQPDFDLNYVRQTQRTRLEKMLCFSFGFGGQNAVLAVGK